jgi:metal-responsive CopG/Arc/MetJ family transcriptional regulator
MKQELRMAEGKTQVNVEMDDELVEFLDELKEEDESTRSAVIRKLLRQEKARRELMNPPSSNNSPKRRKSDFRTAQAVAA